MMIERTVRARVKSRKKAIHEQFLQLLVTQLHRHLAENAHYQRVVGPFSVLRNRV